MRIKRRHNIYSNTKFPIPTSQVHNKNKVTEVNNKVLNLKDKMRDQEMDTNNLFVNLVCVAI